MKNKLFIFLGTSVILLFLNSHTYAQVGIGTITPAEMLDVNGNVKIDGALMPNNLPGNAGQILTSAGVNNPPTWGADLTNVTDITRYVTTGVNINSNTIYSITVTILGVTAGSTAIITITGNWASAIFDDITIHNIEMRTDEVRFAVSNNTGPPGPGTNYPRMEFNITIIR